MPTIAELTFSSFARTRLDAPSYLAVHAQTSDLVLYVKNFELLFLAIGPEFGFTQQTSINKFPVFVIVHLSSFFDFRKDILQGLSYQNKFKFLKLDA